MNIILPPHLKAAIKIEEPKLIIPEAIAIQKMILNREFVTPGSKWDECFAVAQPQVSSQPLRYFVLNPKWKKIVDAFGGEIIVNPRLLSKDKSTRIMFKEGCLSYPFRPIKKVKRYRKIEVTYVIITGKGQITEIPNKILEEIPAIVFQHELQHLNGKSIWED
jgi:peptide deformylase